MGVYFTYSKQPKEVESPSWAYSGFNRFRQRVAEDIGVNLIEMRGFTEKGKTWDTVKSPLKYLLNHSDCDGYISPEKCGEIYFELGLLLEKWEDDYDRQQGKLLAHMMQKCNSYNKRLLFR